MAAFTAFLTLDKKSRITLSQEVREALGVTAGDFILLERTDRGTFELVPATPVPNDQLWFHHPEMQTRIAKAEEDFASSRFTRTTTPQEAQDFLDGLKGLGHDANARIARKKVTPSSRAKTPARQRSSTE
jgi:bifunctional DNA-binding transcriptional regulator/antitoxin component of YhaV-PrlF toxin-antitoxin module